MLLLLIRKTGTDLFWTGDGWGDYPDAEVIVVPESATGRAVPEGGEFVSLYAAHKEFCRSCGFRSPYPRASCGRITASTRC